MRPIIVIPARIGSSRLPNKPLLEIEGKTIIRRVWKNAVRADLCPVLVVTDSEEVNILINNKGGKSIIVSEETASGTDRVYIGIERFDQNKLYDVIINLQGDMPFFEKEILKKVLDIHKHSVCDISTLAYKTNLKRIKNNSNIVKVVFSEINNDICIGRALYFSRSCIPYSAEWIYCHIGIYGYRRNALRKFCSLKSTYLRNVEKLRQLRALENFFIINVGLVRKPPISVDTIKCLERARTYARKNKL